MADHSTVHGLVDVVLSYSRRTSGEMPTGPVERMLAAAMPETLILDGLFVGMALARHQPEYVAAILDDVWGPAVLSKEALGAMIETANAAATGYRRVGNAHNN